MKLWLWSDCLPGYIEHSYLIPLLWWFFISSGTKTFPLLKGKAPTPRAAQAAAKLGNIGYMFGGRHMVKFCSFTLLIKHHFNSISWEKTVL